jgi:hypothetical protein
MGSHSDPDLLIVRSGRYNPEKVAGKIYLCMQGIAQALDPVVIIPD